MNTNDLPIACDMTALTTGERARYEALRKALEPIRVSGDLPDGVAFLWPREKAAALLEWIEMERRCCPFLRFELVLHAGSGPAELSLRGPEGTKDFLKRELGLSA